MSEMKHTPGPWTINRHGAIVGGDFTEYTNGRGQSQIAMATGAHNISDEERNANANLIAAAPDLLDALKRCSKLIEGEVPSFVIDAIAKAQGHAHEGP